MVKPKVTLGVCVKNSAVTLGDAIESILCQNYSHELMEVIFVDDGSSDKTLQVIEHYVPNMDMHVKVYQHEWKGLGLSRNVVVDNAEGDYIIWVDGDMVLPKDHVRMQVEFMEKNPMVGIGKAKHGLIHEDSVVANLENIPFIVYDAKNGSLDSNLPGTGGAIFKVDAIRQVNGLDDRLSGVGEDQDVAYRIKLAGWLIKRSPAVFFERRVQTWEHLWQKYHWYGYGNYTLYLKNRKIFSPYRMTPLAGFISGASLIYYAYKILKSKYVLLLPFHFAFKMTAWCLGFANAQRHH